MNIESIIELKLAESQTLEFKDYYFEEGKFAKLEDKKKMQIAKEISAFSNAEGGLLIMGICEDNNGNPAEIKDVGVDHSTLERWEQSFRQYMSAKVKPIVHGLECVLTEYSGKYILAVKVPESIVKPHAFNDGNKDSFHKRYGNTMNDMRLDDLRIAFQERNILENKLFRFKDERLSEIYSGNIAGELEKKSVLVLQVIPEWSMELNSFVQLSKFDSNQLLDVFSPTKDINSLVRRGISSYNSDGLLINYGYGDMPLMSYTQVFHNGSLETIEVRMMNYSNDNYSSDPHKEYIFNWLKLEEVLVNKIKGFIEILAQNDVPKPYHIFVTFLNVKGKQTVIDYDFCPADSITKDIVRTVPAYITDKEPLSKALHPMLTSLANVFGLKKSSLYTIDGEANSSIFDKQVTEN